MGCMRLQPQRPKHLLTGAGGVDSKKDLLRRVELKAGSEAKQSKHAAKPTNRSSESEKDLEGVMTQGLAQNLISSMYGIVRAIPHV